MSKASQDAEVDAAIQRLVARYTDVKELAKKLPAMKESMTSAAVSANAGVVSLIMQGSSTMQVTSKSAQAYMAMDRVHRWTDEECPAKYSAKFDALIVDYVKDWVDHFETLNSLHAEWEDKRVALDHYKDKVADLQSKERTSMATGKPPSAAFREKLLRNQDKLHNAQVEFSAKREGLIAAITKMEEECRTRMDTLTMRLMQWEQGWFKDMQLAVSKGYDDAISTLQAGLKAGAAATAGGSGQGGAGAEVSPFEGASAPDVGLAGGVASSPATSKRGAAASKAASSTRVRRKGGLGVGSPRSSGTTPKASPRPSAPPASAAAFDPFGAPAPSAPAQGGGGSFDPFGDAAGTSGSGTGADDPFGMAPAPAPKEVASPHAPAKAVGGTQDVFADLHPPR